MHKRSSALYFITAFSFLFLARKWIVSEEMHKVATRLWQAAITCIAHIVNAIQKTSNSNGVNFLLWRLLSKYRLMELHLINKWHFMLLIVTRLRTPVKLLFTTSFQQLKCLGSMIIPDGVLDLHKVSFKVTLWIFIQHFELRSFRKF